MKKHITLIIALSLLLFIFGCGSNKNNNAGSTSEKKTKMIIGLTQSEKSLVGRAAIKFKEQVEKNTNNQVAVEIYFSSQLGTFNEMASQMKVGNVNAMFIQPDALGNQTPLATVNAWPYLFDSPDNMLKAWKSDTGKQLCDEIEKKSGYRLLAPTWNSGRNIYTTRSVSSINDLKGMKLRVPGTKIFIEQTKLMGISPTSLDINEVYTSMQQGVVEGMEGTISDAIDRSLQEVSKSLIVTEHVLSPKMWLMWGQWLDGLNPSYKEAIYKAADEASKFYSEQLQVEEKEYMQKFKSRGVNIVNLPKQELAGRMEPLKNSLPDLAVWAEKIRAAGQ